MAIDPVTQRWIRNASDERAAAAGCTFNEARGRHVIDFAARYLRLYEGELAGQPLTAADWQVEATMRLFGWERFSERWGRKVRRFTKASIFIPKKNGKSPTLAWWGLYLLCADGEQGQKVYFAAKDGQQAREIAAKHALEMLLQSPELMAECGINRNLMQLTHQPTRSLLKPISSGDSRAAKAKEGLNGCILVDETHVVDREFMSRVSRAGISRSEPLQIEVSTAGNDPEGYGKDQFDYGRRVEAGEETDERFFFLAYAAPQDLGDEDLAADPVKYGRMANPTWGRIVGEEEYLDDWNRSRLSLSGRAEFKMYRLNVWQASASPWLDMAAWGRCRHTFTEKDLLGQTCFGGLDLAKTRDTTALALVFPREDGTRKLLVYYWLPEATARRNAHLVPYPEWARAGWLELTPGDTCDYLGFVRRKLNEIRDKFDLRKLAFDDTYANLLVQLLLEEDNWYQDVPVIFKQSLMGFAAPTAAFERRVIDGTLHHNGNPLLTWQVGNTTVKPDVNENVRPVKQKKGDYRTIDGAVAAIMADGVAVEETGYYVPGSLKD